MEITEDAPADLSELSELDAVRIQLIDRVAERTRKPLAKTTDLAGVHDGLQRFRSTNDIWSSWFGSIRPSNDCPACPSTAGSVAEP